MSRKKHNIAYIKPDEPKFLKLMKEQIGYKEGPTVNTKREQLEYDSDSNRSDCDEEKPTVVVLKEGDLTAVEAEEFQMKKKEEEENTRADLTKKIVFNKRKLKTETSDHPKSKTKKKSKKKIVLSFNEEDEEEV